MKRTKGERRKPNAEQQLRELAASIPDQDALNAFMLTIPKAQRQAVYSLIAPRITQFTPAGAVRLVVDAATAN